MRYIIKDEKNSYTFNQIIEKINQLKLPENSMITLKIKNISNDYLQKCVRPLWRILKSKKLNFALEIENYNEILNRENFDILVNIDGCFNKAKDNVFFVADLTRNTIDEIWNKVELFNIKNLFVYSGFVKERFLNFLSNDKNINILLIDCPFGVCDFTSEELMKVILCCPNYLELLTNRSVEIKDDMKIKKQDKCINCLFVNECCKGDVYESSDK